MTVKKSSVVVDNSADNKLNEVKKLKEETGSAVPSGSILVQPIVDEMRQSYLDYAMSVIVSRALPDVRDGLKPVHRRILYAMWLLGLHSGGKFRKSATVVGEVLGKYHPHGDSAVYDAMARLAQDFAMRYPLVKGQGNFGSVDGDRPAAMRYTEAKLAAIAEEMLIDLDKDTVEMIPNFDGSLTEPQVLPAKIPNLLLNGCMGIAVGMATNIPPHNLREVAAAIEKLIDHPEATIEELMECIKGPDFPTGGFIYNHEDILRAYTTGKGGIVMRGRAEIVENSAGNFQIVISEIPYQVNKAVLVERIADLIKDKKIEGVKDLRDESDKEGIRIVLDLKRDSYPKKILNALYKQTPLQETFHVNMLALVNGLQPRILNLKTILEEFVKHRQEIIRRRTTYDLIKAKERAHILEGLMMALARIDEVIAMIKASKDKDRARVNLMKHFKLSEKQAVAILEMKLQTLANLEQLKIETELKEKHKAIADLERILSSESLVSNIIKQECRDMAEKYGDNRRTTIMNQDIKDFRAEDLIPNEEVVVIMTRDGYIKRLPGNTFKVQGRGGKGVLGLTTKEADAVQFLFTTMAHGDLLFFTSRGRMFELKAYELPLASRTAKGQAIVNFLQLASDERITAILPLDKMGDKEYLFFATRQGLVKRVSVDAFANIRRTGLLAIKLKPDDQLIWVKSTSGSDQIQMITALGQAIRFKETDVRDMGRGASGVIGMRLRKGDHIIGMGVINTDPEKIKDYQILSVTAHGYGKRTNLSQYKIQNRGGLGIKTAKITDETGEIVNAFVVDKKVMANKDLIVMSMNGQVIRIPFASVKESGRDTRGVHLMRFKEGGDQVVGVTWL